MGCVDSKLEDRIDAEFFDAEVLVKEVYSVKLVHHLEAEKGHVPQNATSKVKNGALILTPNKIWFGYDEGRKRVEIRLSNVLSVDVTYSFRKHDVRALSDWALLVITYSAGPDKENTLVVRPLDAVYWKSRINEIQVNKH